MNEISLRQKEEIDVNHILAAANDGCACELCEAARTVGREAQKNRVEDRIRELRSKLKAARECAQKPGQLQVISRLEGNIGALEWSIRSGSPNLMLDTQ